MPVAFAQDVVASSAEPIAPIMDEAPANETFALPLIVVLKTVLEFLFVVDIVVNDGLRNFMLRQCLHQNVLLNEVGTEHIDTQVVGVAPVHKDETISSAMY